MDDIKYMKLAIDLAKTTKGQTTPNPVVGAIIINDGRVVGIGAHLKAGEEHAEIQALNMAGSFAEDSTLYVTLEPCSHYGKTPPCVERIIKEKIKRVVIATLDPNPLVSGNGVRILKEAGLHVHVGVQEEEAIRINEDFTKYITTGKPFITVKTAMTLDGKISTHTGDSKWVTCEESRNYVHQLRHEANAILVGIGTILEDNPQLTVRTIPKGLDPIRVIIDTNLTIPLDSNVIVDGSAPAWIFTTKEASSEKINKLKSLGIKIFITDGDKRVPLKEVINKLGEMGITSVLVEGGSKVLGSLFDEKLIDKYICFIAPKLVGGQLSLTSIGGKGVIEMSEAVGLCNLTIERYGEDLCITGYPVW